MFNNVLHHLLVLSIARLDGWMDGRTDERRMKNSRALANSIQFRPSWGCHRSDDDGCRQAGRQQKQQHNCVTTITIELYSVVSQVFPPVAMGYTVSVRSSVSPYAFHSSLGKEVGGIWSCFTTTKKKEEKKNLI